MKYCNILIKKWYCINNALACINPKVWLHHMMNIKKIEHHSYGISTMRADEITMFCARLNFQFHERWGQSNNFLPKFFTINANEFQRSSLELKTREKWHELEPFLDKWELLIRLLQRLWEETRGYPHCHDDV